MPMLIRWIVDVLEPFLQLAVAADPIWSNTRPHGDKTPPQILIHIKNRARFDHMPKQAADDLMIHRRTHHEPTLLRTVTGPADEPRSRACRRCRVDRGTRLTN